MTVLGEDSSNLAAIREAALWYEEETGEKVDVVGVGFEELQELANTDLSTQTGQYDVILQYNFSLATYVQNNWVLGYDEFKALSGMSEDEIHRVESDVYDNVWRELGHYWSPEGPQSPPRAVGLPFAANTMLLVYNKRHLAALGDSVGPPTTWGELEETADALHDPAAGRYGMAMQGGDGGWLYYEWTNPVFSLGGGVMDKEWGWQGSRDTRLLLTGDSTVEATRRYFDLTEYTNPGEYLSSGVSEQGDALRQERASMGIVWSDYVPSILYHDGREDHSDFIGFAPIPGPLSMIAGGLFYINRASPEQERAARFVAYLLRPDIQQRMAAEGLLPAYRSAYTPENLESIPYLDAVRQSVERGVYMNEAGPDADIISAAITTSLQKAWSDYEFDMPVDQRDRIVRAALAEAEAVIQQERDRVFDEELEN
ncbi:MAG: extracellular solute-binding protein [Myxococcota bacterium]